jgi:hypothetical protein
MTVFMGKTKLSTSVPHFLLGIHLSEFHEFEYKMSEMFSESDQYFLVACAQIQIKCSVNWAHISL